MIYDKWWKSPGLTCIRDEMKNKDGKASPLGLDNIGGVFVVLLLGLVIALIASMCEFAAGRRRNQLNQALESQSMIEVNNNGNTGIAYSDGGNSSSQIGIY